MASSSSSISPVYKVYNMVVNYLKREHDSDIKETKDCVEILNVSTKDEVGNIVENICKIMVDSGIINREYNIDDDMRTVYYLDSDARYSITRSTYVAYDGTTKWKILYGII